MAYFGLGYRDGSHGSDSVKASSDAEGSRRNCDGDTENDPSS